MLAAASGLIGFFTGPAGRVVMIALAFVGWTYYQRMDATRDCEEAELREELKESQRQLKIAEDIASGARRRADQTEAQMQELETENAQLQKDLQADPDLRCPLPDELRERLLGIR